MPHQCGNCDRGVCGGSNLARGVWEVCVDYSMYTCIAPAVDVVTTPVRFLIFIIV